MINRTEPLPEEIKARAKKIKLVLTDCDGVLTDGCVYYSAAGEELKKFSFRDGMGIVRLRNTCNIDTGIITQENSQIVARRAEKLKITHLYLNIHNKAEKIKEILAAESLSPEELAYIGDDVNDIEALGLAGLSACPANGLPAVKKTVHYICSNPGGDCAFRELAELIIESQKKNENANNHNFA